MVGNLKSCLQLSDNSANTFCYQNRLFNPKHCQLSQISTITFWFQTLTNWQFITQFMHGKYEPNSTILIQTAEWNHCRVWNVSPITVMLFPGMLLTPGIYTTIWLWQGHYSQNCLLNTSVALLFCTFEWKYIAWHILWYKCNAKIKNKLNDANQAYCHW